MGDKIAMETKVWYCKKCDRVYPYSFNKYGNNCVFCDTELVKAIKTEEKNYNSLRLVNFK